MWGERGGVLANGVQRACSTASSSATAGRRCSRSRAARARGRGRASPEGAVHRREVSVEGFGVAQLGNVYILLGAVAWFIARFGLWMGSGRGSRVCKRVRKDMGTGTGDKTGAAGRGRRSAARAAGATGVSLLFLRVQYGKLGIISTDLDKDKAVLVPAPLCPRRASGRFVLRSEAGPVETSSPADDPASAVPWGDRPLPQPVQSRRGREVDITPRGVHLAAPLGVYPGRRVIPPAEAKTSNAAMPRRDSGWSRCGFVALL